MQRPSSIGKIPEKLLICQQACKSSYSILWTAEGYNWHDELMSGTCVFYHVYRTGVHKDWIVGGVPLPIETVNWIGIAQTRQKETIRANEKVNFVLNSFVICPELNLTVLLEHSDPIDTGTKTIDTEKSDQTVWMLNIIRLRQHNRERSTSVDVFYKKI